MRYSLLFIGLTSILLGGCGLLDESRFVLSNPQYVIPNVTSTGSIDFLKVNGEIWSLSPDSIKIGPGGPRKNLAGVDGVGIIIKSKKGEFDRNINLSLLIPSNDDGKKMVIESSELWIDNLSDISLHRPYEVYRTHLYEECPTGIGRGYRGADTPPVIPLIPRGSVILEQRTKHIILKGTFDIPPTAIPRDPYMICEGNTATGKLIRNPSPPAIIKCFSIFLSFIE